MVGKKEAGQTEKHRAEGVASTQQEERRQRGKDLKWRLGSWAALRAEEAEKAPKRV